MIHIFWYPRYLDYKALKKVMKTGEGEAGSLWSENGPDIYIYMVDIWYRVVFM